MLEELARVIAGKPMTMSDDESGENDTALPQRGLSGSDWATALSDQFLDDSGLDPGNATGAAARVSRAYTHLTRR
jgi:hypothetical protein